MNPMQLTDVDTLLADLEAQFDGHILVAGDGDYGLDSTTCTCDTCTCPCVED
jgi:hypothetical protein